jgi:thioredoxin 1
VRTEIRSCRNVYWFWCAPLLLASLLTGCMGHSGLVFPWMQTQEAETSRLEHVTLATFEDRVMDCKQTVLVDFYAEWCGPCKKLGPVLEDFAKEHPEVRVVKVNVDANRALADRYQVQSMPTLLVIRDKQVVTRSVGAIPKEQMAAMTR